MGATRSRIRLRSETFFCIYQTPCLHATQNQLLRMSISDHRPTHSRYSITLVPALETFIDSPHITDRHSAYSRSYS
jgi:hypothetical protein